MTRRSMLQFNATQTSFYRFLALSVLSLVVACAGSAQHAGGAMGHGSARPHFMGPVGAHMAGPAAHSQHLYYQPPFRGARPAPRNFARPTFGGNVFHTAGSRASFVNPSRFRRNRFFYANNFGIPTNGFFPYAYGFFPWWGWDDSDSGYNNRCNGYDAACEAGPADAPGDANYVGSNYAGSSYGVSYIDGGESYQRPLITVYLRDGSGYGALDYWVSGGMLHIETTYGVHKSFPMEEVDLERTGKENAQQGVNFTFHTAPMISDPGSVLAPESYAPPCPDGSSVSARKSEQSSTKANQAFGALGETSAKGFAVTSVRANSPAAQAGLQVGDVVVRIDCQPIRNSQDLESAFAGSPGGVWVSYLIQGSWLTDKHISR
jgi:hypothetical protein